MMRNAPKTARTRQAAACRAAIIAGLLVAAVDTSPARAQVPPDIARRLVEIGRVVDPAATQPLYRPLHGLPPFDGVTITRDATYGGHPRQRLDVFAATPAAPGARPVLLFVHGGAFTRGDKTQAGSPFYNNVGAFAARNGLVGVTMTYRLAPEFGWPAGADDVAAAVSWIRTTIARFGGDPARIVVMGHSAGATHVAGFLARADRETLSALSGAILSSGLYELTPETVGDPERSYFGADPALYRERAPMPGLIASGVPLLIAAGELDRPDFSAQAERAAALARAAGRPFRLVVLTGHSHMSSVFSIGTADRSWSDAILAFVRQPR